jgi:Ser/Thr protein kinase RdoA (MazF antagonist)
VTIARAKDLDLNPADVANAAGRFGIAEAERLGGFENALFRSSDPPGRILRLTHTSRRSVEMVLAEFEFMAHVAAQGVQVVAPIRSLNGQLVEEVEIASGDHLVVACMTEAPGRFRRPDDWTDAEIKKYGELLGAMHRATKGFEPHGTPRPLWTDPIFDAGLSAAEVSDPELFHRVAEIRAACAIHEAGSTGLLIHQDAHYGNLHITDDGLISMFDFDDCAYGTPTHDIAIVLFYWLMGLDEEQHSVARRFVANFLRGYERHQTIPHNWPDGADRFLSLREVDLYWLIAKESPDEVLPAEERFMDGRRDRILNGVPYLGSPLADVL